MYCEYIIYTGENWKILLTFKQKVPKLSIRQKSDGLWRVRLLRSNWPHEATRALPPGCWKQLAPGYWATWKTFQVSKVAHLCKLTNISPMPISALISSLSSFLKTNIARKKKPSVKIRSREKRLLPNFETLRFGCDKGCPFEAESKVAKIERTIGLSVSQAEEPLEKVSCIRMLGHQQQLISINMKQPILSLEWRYFWYTYGIWILDGKATKKVKPSQQHPSISRCGRITQTFHVLQVQTTNARPSSAHKKVWSSH